MKLTVNFIARLGLYLEDPYGDGIRLDCIRNPDAGRLAALAEIGGEPLLGGSELIKNKYESEVKEFLENPNPELWMNFTQSHWSSWEKSN